MANDDDKKPKEGEKTAEEPVSTQLVPVLAFDPTASEEKRLEQLQSQLPNPPQAVPDTRKQQPGESWADYRLRADHGNFAERVKE